MANRGEKFRLRFLFQEFDLSPGEFSVGRSPSCNLTLEDPLVSRCHARITVLSDHAVLDDLGSRNGTLVNGEPVFENHRLNHSDRIRIGSHDLVFIEERRYPPVRLKPTASLIICPSCSAPFTENEPACPRCGAQIVPDKICLKCKTPGTVDALFCAKCGAPLERDESTIPVELGGGSSGWTAALICEVIDKALFAQRFEQAARLLDGKIAELDRAKRTAGIDREELALLSQFNLAIAAHTQEQARVEWVLDHYRQAEAAMPPLLVDQMERMAPALLGRLVAKIEAYAAALSTEGDSDPEIKVIAKRLYDLTENMGR